MTNIILFLTFFLIEEKITLLILIGYYILDYYVLEMQSLELSIFFKQDVDPRGDGTDPMPTCRKGQTEIERWQLSYEIAILSLII